MKVKNNTNPAKDIILATLDFGDTTTIENPNNDNRAIVNSLNIGSEKEVEFLLLDQGQRQELLQLIEAGLVSVDLNGSGSFSTGANIAQEVNDEQASFFIKEFQGYIYPRRNEWRGFYLYSTTSMGNVIASNTSFDKAADYKENDLNYFVGLEMPFASYLKRLRFRMGIDRWTPRNISNLQIQVNKLTLNADKKSFTNTLLYHEKTKADGHFCPKDAFVEFSIDLDVNLQQNETIAIAVNRSDNYTGWQYLQGSKIWAVYKKL